MSNSVIAQKAAEQHLTKLIIANITDLFPVASGNVSAAHFSQVRAGVGEYQAPVSFRSTTK